MKQQYTILKNIESNDLLIREFAELDKEVLSMICEQKYPGDAVRAAIDKGKIALLSVLRTPNMYPPGIYMDRIADSVISLYKTGDGQPVDLIFDDADFLTKYHKEEEVIEEIEEESEDINDLLDEDIEDEFDDTPSINPMNSSIKIADDDSLDMEDES